MCSGPALDITHSVLVPGIDRLLDDLLSGSQPPLTLLSLSCCSLPKSQTCTIQINKQTQTHPNIGITKKSMEIMNDFVNDMMEKIASEAKNDLGISRKEKTMREWHMNTATKLVLPGELEKHGINEGTKVICTFNAARSKNEKKE